MSFLRYAAVKAGAQAAVGFREKIDCNEANKWTKNFLRYYFEEGKSIYESAERAANDCSDSRLRNYRIVLK